MVASPVAIALIGFVASLTMLSAVYMIHCGFRGRARRPE
jgi:hypothetical protein